jgi:uncharacterized membrane protein YhiD involved in acid resistance
MFIQLWLQSLDPYAFGLDLLMLARVMLATALGSVVGYERERAGKPAGARTHGMVALGSALFTVVSLYAIGAGDHFRLIAQIVSGRSVFWAQARSCMPKVGHMA